MMVEELLNKSIVRQLLYYCLPKYLSGPLLIFATKYVQGMKLPV
jgi:hypothetical protein